MNRQQRNAAARNPATGPATLERLAAEGDGEVRYLVASNPATPAPVLEHLAVDAWYIREGVAQNPQCPSGLLQHLATDRDMWVRAAAADHERLPTALREQIAAADPNAPVRYAAKRRLGR